MFAAARTELRRRRQAFPAWLLPVLILSLSFPRPSFCQESLQDALEPALVAFQHEDFEEAAALLESLCERYPDSAQCAFYLGLTYKRLQDYQRARPHLFFAVQARTPVPEAFGELIELLYQQDELAEARRWIAESERHEIITAQTRFLKGLVYMKEGKDPGTAIEAFEEVLWFDPSYEQAVKYQLALAHAQLKEYLKAESFLREVIVADPAADLALYADEYIGILERQKKAAQPFHGSFGCSLQYDSNVVAVPTDERLAAGVDQEDDFKYIYTAQGDYTHRFDDTVSLKTGYSLLNIKQDSIGFYDSFVAGIPVTPTFTLDGLILAFPLQYTFTTLDGRTYLATWSAGVLNNFILERNTMLQAQLQYTAKDYRWSPDIYDNTRSGREYVGGLGWYRFFGTDRTGLVSLRYALHFDDTRGQNWRCLGNKFSFAGVLPLSSKLTWNLLGDYFRNDFMKMNSVYSKDRLDDVVTVSNVLSYKLFDNTELQVQHAYIHNGSTIAEYDYDKQAYTVGVKYSF